MASKVNTKFVVLLVAGLALVCVGLVGLAYFQHMRSSERLVAQGDKFMAEGEFKLASEKYSRAVFKDQGNLGYLEKWRDAMLKTTPATQPQYNEAYSRHYTNVLNKMAVLRPRDPEYQLPLIEELDKRLRQIPGGLPVAAIQSQIETINERLKQVEDAENPITKRIIGMRGFAGLREMQMFPVDEARRAKVLEDLRVGASVTTDNPRFHIAIVDWYEAEIDRLERRENRPEDARALREPLAEARADLVARFADRPAVMVHEFRSEARAALNATRTPEAYREALRGLQAPATDLFARLEAIPIDRFTVEEFMDSVVTVDEFSGRTLTAELAVWADKFVELRPQDPRTLITAARLHRADKDQARALELLDRCAALPDVPLSLEGLVQPMYRRIAAAERVDTALIQRELSTDPGEKARLLDEAKRQRDALRALVDAGSEWELDLRNARIAMVEQDYRRAIALFDKLRSQGQADNPAILLPLASALASSGSEGMARTIYERLLANGHETIEVFAQLADIEIGLNNIPRAIELLERAQQVDPSNNFVNARLTNLRSAGADPDTSASGPTNPVLALAIKARRAREEGNLALARTLLREALDLSPGDVRLVREAVGVELAAGDRPAALALVEEASAIYPDNVPLRSLRTQVEIEDPIRAAEQIIADSTESPVAKALALYVVYTQNNLTDKATEAFAQAEKADPDYPGVVEIGFGRALRQGANDGMARATEYAERAARLNIDQRGGLTFQGRLELAKGNFAAAEQTLQRAAQQMEFDPNTWRWLGLAQYRLGKIDQAIVSYQRAYAGDPRDASIATQYAELLVTTGQGPKALSVISPETGVLQFNQRDPSLIGLWLELEAAFGDRAKALETRGKILSSEPENIGNARAYLMLLVQDGRFEDAERVIEMMAATPGISAQEVASARARLLAQQGNVSEARALLMAAVESIPKDRRTVQEYLLLGAFDREYGAPEDALESFSLGLEYQDPKIRELDRAIGDLHFTLGDRAMSRANTLAAEGKDDQAAEASAQGRAHYAQATERYEAISKADPSAAEVKKRLAETLIRMGEHDRAFAVLTSVEKADDLQVLLLTETLATRKGDTRAARAALDRAVELYPNDPMPFYRRASVNRTDPARSKDVIDDLDQAVRLRPGMIEAWQLRVAFLADEGRTDEAVAQLGRAVQANPKNDDLILYYIRVLNGMGRRDEAKKTAIDVAAQRETDINWIRRAALLAYDQGDYQQAEALYEKVYKLEPGSGPAMDLLNSYLRRTNPPPTRAEVNRILPLILQDAPTLTPGGKMLLARAREFLEERAEAERWTLEAYEMAKPNPFDTRLWFENLVLRFKNDRERAFEYVLNTKQLQPLPPAIRLLTLRREVTKGRSVESALETLEEMRAECETHPYTVVEMYRLRNMFHYSIKDFEAAAEDCRQGLRLVPRDLEFNNNLAYILAKHLDDAAAAEPHAVLAAEIAPTDPAVLDTLGWVYFKVGKYRDADRTFARSIDTSKVPDDFVPTYLHQAQSKKAIGDLTEATHFIRLAKSNLDKASQQVKDLYTDEIEALLKELTEGE